MIDPTNHPTNPGGYSSFIQGLRARLGLQAHDSEGGSHQYDEFSPFSLGSQHQSVLDRFRTGFSNFFFGNPFVRFFSNQVPWLQGFLSAQQDSTRGSAETGRLLLDFVPDAPITRPTRTPAPARPADETQSVATTVTLPVTREINGRRYALRMLVQRPDAPFNGTAFEGVDAEGRFLPGGRAVTTSGFDLFFNPTEARTFESIHSEYGTQVSSNGTNVTVSMQHAGNVRFVYCECDDDGNSVSSITFRERTGRTQLEHHVLVNFGSGE